MLLEKYAPRTVKEIAGNGKQTLEIKEWLASWTQGTGLILYGPPGVGKSTSAKLAAEECGYDVLESSGEEQNKELVEKLVSASRQRSISGRRRVILVHDAEHSNTRSLSMLIKECALPVLIVMENPYNTQLRHSCRLVKFSRIRTDSIEKLLREICRKERIAFDERALCQLARQSGGDVRAAIIDLESAGEVTMHAVKNMGYRNSVDGIFDTLKVMFNTSSLSTALAAIEKSEKAPEDVYSWVAENAKEAGNFADVYDALSRADIARARILRRQSWTMQKHFIALTAAAAASSGGKMFMFSFPKYRPSEKHDVSRLHVSGRRAFLYRNFLDGKKTVKK